MCNTATANISDADVTSVVIKYNIRINDAYVVTSSLPAKVLGRVWAVHLGHEMANERLLIESCVVGAQEVKPRAEQTVMVELQSYTHITNVILQITTHNNISYRT